MSQETGSKKLVPSFPFGWLNGRRIEDRGDPDNA